MLRTVQILVGVALSCAVLGSQDTQMKLLFYTEMMLFIAVLFAGLLYIWKKGVLEWNR